MFSLAKVSAAVLALASFAQATITINTDSLTANTTDTIQWTSTDPNNDPESFSIELTNTLFHDNFAIGNNIQTTTGSFTFEMPVVPAGPGYSISFVNPGNISDIISSSPTFSILQNNANTTTPGSSSVSGVTTASFASSATPSLTNTSPGASITPFSSGGTGSASNSGSGTVASATGANGSTSSPSAAMDLVPSGSLAALIAGAIALLF